MAKLIALDDGHGSQTSGKRTPAIPELGGRVIHENEFNKAVVALLDKELKRNGFNTLLVAPTDADTPLITRTNLANQKKADLYISIHYNALDASFGGADPSGFSAHVYLGNKNTKSGQFAKIALKYLAEGTKQINRGLVEQDLHVTRETKMPAVLFECGFMDNKREALLMIDKGFQKEVATELARAVCEFYGVKYKAEEAEPAKPVEKPAEASGATHKVAKGDTLYGIAKDAGMTVAELKALNGLKGDLINVGDELKLKGDGKVYHTVEKGDTVFALGKRYGTKPVDIRVWNKLDIQYNINVGDKLRVK